LAAYFAKPPAGSVLRRGHPLGKGLVYAAILAEGAGAKYADSAQKQLPSATTGPPTWTAGPFGRALDFGTGGKEWQVQHRPNAAPAATTSAWSACAVCQPTAFSASGSVVIAYGEIDDAQFTLNFGLGSTGTVALGGNGALDGPASTGTVSTGTWVRVGFAQGSDTSRSFLVNGKVEANTTSFAGNAGNIHPAVSAPHFAVGRGYQNGALLTGTDFQGKLAAVFVWNRRLMNAELRRWYADPFEPLRRGRLPVPLRSTTVTGGGARLLPIGGYTVEGAGGGGARILPIGGPSVL
jgi:hypothetical protein